MLFLFSFRGEFRGPGLVLHMVLHTIFIALDVQVKLL